jgi:hypothetical protein
MPRNPIEGNPSPIRVFSAPPTGRVHKVHLLDASSSMNEDGKFAQASLGIQEDLKIAQDTGIATYTLASFDYDVHLLHFMKLPAQVKLYLGYAHGMTSLYQAIGETLEEVRKKLLPGDRILCNIFTDGGENHSKGKWADAKVLQSFLKELEAEGHTITFTGTELDVQTIIKTLNIARSNTLVHDNTGVGMAEAFEATKRGTQAYMNKVMVGDNTTTNFYQP